jgi:transposase-like protein
MSPATANGNGGRVGYYACAKRIKFGTAACNSPASRINAAALHEATAREIARTFASPSRLSGWVRLAQEAAPGREELEAKEADAARLLRNNERQIRALLNLAKKAGATPLRSVAKELAALEDEGEVLSEALDAARAAVAAYREQKVNVSAAVALLGDFGKWWSEAQNAEERETLLRGFVDRVDLVDSEPGVTHFAVGMGFESPVPAPSGVGLDLQGVGPTSGTRRGMVRDLDAERDAARSNYEPATPLTPPGGRSTHPSEGATRRVRVTVPVAVATGKGGKGRKLSAKGRA